MMQWYQKRTYRDVDGRRVPGFLIPAFIHNHHYYVASIGVYQDGVIDCWGLMSLDEFKAKVATGWVVSRVPEGATVGFGKIIYFTATNCATVGDESDLVKDVANALDELNGRPIAMERLMRASSG